MVVFNFDTNTPYLDMEYVVEIFVIFYSVTETPKITELPPPPPENYRLYSISICKSMASSAIWELIARVKLLTHECN